MSPKRKKAITPLAFKTSASKMLAPKPLAPKPLVANPLSFETLSPAIHPSPLSNLTTNLLLQQRQFSTTQLQVDSLNELTSKYNELLSLNISRDQENSSPLDPIAINPSSATISTVSHDPTSAFVMSSVSNRSTNRWTSTETRMLINKVGRYQKKLKNVRDPKEKGRIWNMITSNIQTSDAASSVLKERTKTSI
ncbi:258_t:CDS:2 [Cetraspora pellucida]|uniref:258_t:CDS:1 n=1 Tax=Cetraspora pellucida TaxID=1433469 RepID=A0A9N9FBT0_9GLOM|nr:258_t:CDS:2 [Cetraspora pellucida]